MENIETRQRRFGWRLFGAAIAPFVVISAYLIFTHWSSYRFAAFGDYVCLTFSVLAGAVFVVMLPIRPLHRTLSLLVYVPLLATVLFFYTFWFIALVFHDGL